MRTGFAGILCFMLLALTVSGANQEVRGETIKAGSEIGYPPYCIVTEGGDADGFSVELMRESLQKMGINVTFSTGQWSEVKKDLEEGRVDALPLVGRTPEREEKFDFTVPYLTMKGVIVTRTNSNNIMGLEDLADKKVAVMKGDNAEEFVSRIKLGAKIFTEPTYSDALKKLSAGRYDAVITHKFLALQMIRDLELNNLTLAEAPLEEYLQHWCFAVRKGDADLLAVLNEGLSLAIADGTYRRLRRKWLKPMEDIDRKTIIVGADRSYPPYEFLNKNGKPDGFNTDIMKAVADTMDMEISFIFGPWPDIKQKLLDGEIDVLQGLIYSQQRGQIYDFSHPHFVVSQVIVTRKDFPDINSLDGLKGKTVLVQDGDYMHEKAVEKGLEVLIAVENTREILLRLSEGEADAALLDYMPASYWKRELGLENIKFSSSIDSADYSFAVRSGDTSLLGTLSAGLAQIRESGRYHEIYDKWFAGYDKQSPWQHLKAAGLYIIGPIILIFLLGIAGTFILRKKVAKRTTELTAANKSLLQTKKHLAETVQEKEEINKFLNNILESSTSVSIIATEMDGTISYLNEGARRMLGYGQEEVVGLIKSSEFYYDESARTKIENIKDKILKDKKPQSVVIPEKTRQGKKIWVSITISPRLDSAGNIIGMLGVGKDITKELEHKNHIQKNKWLNKVKSEIWKIAALKGTDEKSLIREILNRIGPALGVCRAGYLAVNSANDDAVIIYEWTADGVEETPTEKIDRKLINLAIQTNLREISKESFEEFVPDDLRPLFEETVQKMEKEYDIEKIWLFPVFMKDELSAVLTFDICSSNNNPPILDRDTELFIEEVMRIVANALEKKELEESAGQLKKQLLHSQKMESLGRLAGGIAHDFNNILTAVIGDAELLLEEDEIQGQSREDIENIKKNSRRAADLVSQLLVFSRNHPIDKQPISIDGVIKDSLKMLRRLIRENIVIKTTLNSGDTLINADRTNMEQVITNLSLNAGDAMPSGGEIVIETSSKVIEKKRTTPHGDIDPGNYLRLSVEDTGTGMDEDILDKIFDPFFTTKGTAGTGLGLPVVFGIVNDHDAAIDVYSEPGEGTRFSIYFPVSNQNHVPESDRGEGGQKEYDGNREKILVVEDDPQTRTLAVKILKKKNYAVAEAKDINGAIEKYKENDGNYDLIFSDMILPGGDGLELCRKLEKIKPPKNVLLTSGYLDGESRWEEIKERNIPFISKPYGVQNLLEKIHRILFDNPA